MEGERYAPSTFLGRQARPLPAGPLAPARWRSRRWVLVPARRDRPRTHDLWKTTHPARRPPSPTRGGARPHRVLHSGLPHHRPRHAETRGPHATIAVLKARRPPRHAETRGPGRGTWARGVAPSRGARARGRARQTENTTGNTRGGAPARRGGPAGADDEGQEDRGHEREGPEPLGLSRLRACARRARGGTRTPMIVRSHGPEPCASTNSATRARSEADDSRSGPPASNQSDPQTGETRHPPDPSAPPPHPPGHTGYDGPDGSVPAEEPVILGGEEHGVPGQVREGR